MELQKINDEGMHIMVSFGSQSVVLLLVQDV